MKYAINDTSGRWWTGTCWGVEQGRKEYEDVDSLPETIDEDNSYSPGKLLFEEMLDGSVDYFNPSTGLIVASAVEV